MPTSHHDRTATVWSSTFIPTKSPFSDFGAEGYSVAWVDVEQGRLQVLVDGDRPVPGTVGRLVVRSLDGVPVDLFTADPR
ncbi:hypothetical protein [Mycobacterium sp. ACS4331]|uniref:hypothetical protein n=1 Tax=Mycobacterium sp. ACS4331 TaxID=1834121 RepID=UPI0007FDEE27|nr:hypothetical protein [Mycobacterium sp. ACS4331]OBF24843.1 hypothetical protein A5727_06240 [Mycobacterium sp. ACS4331]